MLKEIGVKDIEELYADIPEKFRLKKRLELPDSASEYKVKRCLRAILSKNKTFNEMPIFLGAGCWPHYVPTVVDEVVGRAEFLTSYYGEPELRFGLGQVIFEYQSMIGEITAMDVVNASLYDWASALGESACMVTRVTGRNEFLVPKIINPERLMTLNSYAEPAGIHIKLIGYNPENGQLDLEDLKSKISSKTAGVYIENPTYLGFIESQCEEISKEARNNEALFVVGVDPTSLGALKPPGEYGADIVVGEGQPLGNHMNYGGPNLGIIACQDKMQLIRQIPGKIMGMTTTVLGDDWGFCHVLNERSFWLSREKATTNMSSNSTLCAVAAAVYLALLGPEGLRELGNAIMQKSHYAMKLMSEISCVNVPIFKSTHFKEFTVNFDGTDKTLQEIHRALLKCNVHGGKAITDEFPELGKSALYCVTEMHTKEDIENLVCALKQALK